MGDGSTVLRLHARWIPAGAISIALFTILASVVSCVYHGHDIGGLYWPYISDTAKEMPQAGLFAYGMSVVSVLLLLVVLINHGKVKLNLYALAEGEEGTYVKGLRRAKVARAAGCIAAPGLGLLACYDTARAPALHLVFVLAFFAPCLVYCGCMMSVYSLMARRLHERRQKLHRSIPRLSYVSLETSLRWKRRIALAFAFFFTLYLPVGMSLVTNWFDYTKDVKVHTFRAVCQHGSVIALLFFFGTMWHDFGDLQFRIRLALDA